MGTSVKVLPPSGATQLLPRLLPNILSQKPQKKGEH